MSIAVSIVSHGHALHARGLLGLLARPDVTPIARVWLTLNIPEVGWEALHEQHWPFELCLLHNAQPLGFGANHNQAFAHELAQANPAPWFAVLNPDLAWEEDPFPALLQAVQRTGAGCAYPMQLDPQGRVQDHKRGLPTPASLWKRHTNSPEVGCSAQVDWVNAAFLLFPSAVFAKLEGFDTRYFMYCEDVDLSLRLQLAGYTLEEAPQARVVHDAHRASRRSLRHLFWHLRSLLRLWFSDSFRSFKARRAAVTIQT